jgi:inosine-uridine nucleoside N-ribohydrolase
MRPAIILDCDPGHDDALAILLAGRTTELIGITVVSGNAPLDKTLRNALVTAQIAGLDVPVHAGAARPLLAEPLHAAFIHGDSGLDGPELPALRRVAASADAVRFLIDTARARDDLWLVATGPLTNVALALREAPDLAERLRGISLMGGAWGPGNVSAAAEFNILADPEAAAIVFASGARLVMAGLDVTHQFMIDGDRRARLAALGTDAARFAAALLRFYGEAYARAFGGEPQGPLHDPCAVLALTQPELFTSEERHVVVETRGQHTRGMTVVDRRGGDREATPNTRVLTRIDADAAFAALSAALSGYP